MIRNNNKPHRDTEANQRRTESIIEAYYGKEDLRRTWELADPNVQSRNHAYILKLRAKIRNVKNYIQHRATPDSDL